MPFLDELAWRGLIQDSTDRQALAERLSAGPITLYCGFDPTADSLHVGHLLGIITLARFQRAGHRPIALAGGATGMIGDPSGKSAERKLLSREELAHNTQAIKAQLARFLDFEAGASLLDNADWLAPMRLIEFLREVGKHFSLSAMLAKESVKQRLASESGISYTEFSYQLLQAYDFLYLRRHHGCELQIGGSDQWGNITAGCELIRRTLGVPVHGLTFPLLTKADGSKFGKTEQGAVWLDPRRTSPYRFYQFFLNVEDAMVGTLLRRLSFRSPEEIAALEADQQATPERRPAQRALAQELTRLVHGEQALAEAEKAAAALFGGKLEELSEALLAEVVAEIPASRIPRARFAGEGLPIVELLTLTGLSGSKAQARRDIEGGGISLNNIRVSDPFRRVDSAALLCGRYLLLRKGRKQYAAVIVED
ncbi:MAG: tyrosine--tRNA ligase [Lysobacterales bacterium]|jgi:tyrosyl-tRNA synthetase|nr:MAG: tyrosine--tRNA ligase [Xanthomonadales bacterium]